jgi:EAL domain-containing protein (putative c-di-GMP-specific phosphodiesterase class I)
VEVVAEGGETEELRDLLLAAGCDFGQGYWFSKPVTVEEFEQLVFQGDGRVTLDHPLANAHPIASSL